MKKLLRYIFIVQIFIFSITNAQSVLDMSVVLNATVQNNPPRITLSWYSSTGVTNYTVQRKLKTDVAWGGVIATLNGNATQYIDNNVNIAESYEYKIVKNKSNGIIGYGYINAGIEIPIVEDRGTIILVIDNTFTTSLAAEIALLKSDLAADGWKVTTLSVSRTASVPSVKSQIVNTYNQNTTNTKAVFLLGHVPVPYSGEIYPDGHSDHEGAWPADVYYADMNGAWTDNTANITWSSDTRNRNIPGDGKFDQSYIASDLELQIGRVDLSNLSAFSSNETILLKNYLNKAHDYKFKNFATIKRALIDDNFGYFNGEGFAASAWKNFGPLVGNTNISQSDYFPTMTGNSYLWSYGCGGGNYSQCNGIGSINNLASSNLEGIFAMFFGSYFGDWDTPNNFLRGPLAQGKTLASVWSGRPHWQFHHMGLGETIGYSTQITQNNEGNYFSNYGERFTHFALMGDPTLRNDVVAPVSAIIATKSGPNCNIVWTPSADAIGYNLYSKNDTFPTYKKINTSLITSNNYVDSCLIYSGTYSYMIKAVKLETTPSGSYYNMSLGIADTAYNSNNYTLNATVNFVVNGNVVNFTTNASVSNTFNWNFDDGAISNLQNPSHTFLDGNYYVSLITNNLCGVDSIFPQVQVGANNVPLKPTNFTNSKSNVCNNNVGIVYTVPSFANVNYVWHFTGTGATINGAGNSITIDFDTLATSGILSVTPSNTFGNGLSRGIFITVNQPPIIGISGVTTICEGASTQLTANGVNNFLWSNGTTGNNLITSPTITTIYTVIGTSTNLCTSTQSVVVNVLPEPILTLTSNVVGNTFCLGTVVTFTATAGFDNYIFKKNNAIVQNGILDSYTNSNLQNNDAIIVSVTSLDGCSKTTSPIINSVASAFAAPTITIASGSNPFCFGSSVTLHSSSAIGNIWSNGETTQNVVVTNTEALSLFYSSNNCLSATANYTATQKPQLISQINGTLVTCASSTVLSATAIVGYPASVIYEWTYPNSSIQTGLTKTVTVSGTYSLKVYSPDNCAFSTSSVVVSLGFLSAPVITAGGAITFCVGDSVTLTSNIASNIVWSTGAITQSIKVKLAGAVTFTATNGNCQLTSAPTTISLVYPPIPPIISAASETNICAGQTVLLSGNTNGMWNNNSSNNSITATSTGNYFVTTTNICGASISNVIAVNVTPLPVAPNISVTGNTVLCPNQSVTLNGNTNGVWNISSNPSASANIVSAPGSYFVTTTNACGSSFSNSLVVTAYNIFPTITAIGSTNICNGNSVFLNSNVTSGVWSNGATSPTISTVVVGNYFFTTTNTCGSFVSNTITVTSFGMPAAPVISANGNTTFCYGDSVELIGNSGGVWSGSTSTDASIFVHNSGDYFVTLSYGCGQVLSNIIKVAVYITPDIPDVTNLYLCEGIQLTNSDSLFAAQSGQGILSSTSVSFNITNLITDEGVNYPGALIASISLPALPNNATYAYSSININGIAMTTGGNAFEAAFSVFGGFNVNSFNLATSAQSPNPFNGNFVFDNTTNYPTQGGALDLKYYEFINTNIKHPDCHFPSTGTYTVWYYLPTTINWYADSSNSNFLQNGSSFNLIDNGNNSSEAIYYVTSSLGSCSSAYAPISLVFEDPINLPTIQAVSNDLCKIDTVLLYGNVGGYWNDAFATNTDSLFVTQPGSYFVTVANSCGITFSSIIKVTTCVEIIWYLDADNDGHYVSSQNSGTSPGIGWTLTLPTGGSDDCNDNNPNVFAYANVANIVASGVTSFCVGGSVTLSGNVSNTWSNGSTAASISVNSSGNYYLSSTNLCGTSLSNIITVTVDIAPIAEIISAQTATTFCAGGSVTLTENSGGTWSSGGSTNSINVNSAGTYFVTTTNSCGSATSNSIVVTVNPLPIPIISGASNFCPSSTATLSTTQNFVSYFWNNASTSQSINVTVAQIYSVVVTNNGCTGSASVTLNSCSTLPTGSIAPSQCGYLSQVPNGYIKATTTIGAINYLYSFYTIGSTIAFATNIQNSLNLYFGQVTTPNTGTITGTAFNWGTQYDVTVTPILSGNVFGNPSAKCRFGFINQPTPTNIAATNLKSPTCKSNSNTATVVQINTVLTCNTVTQASSYQYKLVNIANANNNYLANATYVNQLNLASLSGLVAGATYAVSVRATIYGVQAANFGPVCYIKLQGAVAKFNNLPDVELLNTKSNLIDASLSLNVNVFPNPFSTDASIFIESNCKFVSAEIMELTGKTIASKQLSTNTNYTFSELNILCMKGIYLLKITTEIGQSKVLKFVKN